MADAERKRAPTKRVRIHIHGAPRPPGRELPIATRPQDWAPRARAIIFGRQRA